ncbi:UNKNOWN [Stylonychia lemnae]|uniref:TmcB/TmcC TPR repeats domain-containing protein n=1 Tax=Stylonychia lemnae TaxID=5949 RepID=A0A078A9Y1_STYLE|nr:UNKNOWN [Stylonychia lemnae]|eukprot:CDW77608.1 UNKNOWN [Stylonychia lemnae]
MFETVFYHFKHEKISTEMELLEIFLKISKYNHIISSYFRLVEIKDRLTSRMDKQKYAFLQNMIIQSYLAVEKKHDLYDAEKTLQIEQDMVQYKLSIIQTTLQVQRFWLNLSSKNISLEELMDQGDKIVQSYLIYQQRYEQLIRQQPDLAEAVLYHLQFCQNVMNFEQESLHANILYKKIQEKRKIVFQNLYNNQKNYAIVIVTNKNGKKNQVVMVNKIFEDAAGVQAHQVIDKNINNFMPIMVAINHDRLIDHYLKSYNGSPYNRVYERVWLKKPDESILPVRAQLITCVSQTHGLLLVVFVEIAPPIEFKNMLYQSTTPYFLISDEHGFIYNSTPNFVEKFFKTKDSFIQDYRFKISDIFPFINNFTDEELDTSVETRMNKYFFNTMIDQQKFLDIKLKVINYNFKLGIKVKELIFVESLKTVINFDTLSNQSASNNELSDQYKNNAELYESNEGTNFEYSGGSQSSQSSNDVLFKSLVQKKNELDINQLPTTFLNLKRGVFIFFFLMISNLIALLTVTLVSNFQYIKDEESIKNTMYLNREFSNLRLSFRLLIIISQRGNNTAFLDYQDIINHLNDFQQQIQTFQNRLQQDEHSKGTDLYKFINDRELILEELQLDGNFTTTQVTLNTGFQQFISKIVPILQKNETQLVQIFKNFFIMTQMPNKTQTERDAWFVIQNGNHNLWNYLQQLSDLYIEMGQS